MAGRTASGITVGFLLAGSVLSGCGTMQGSGPDMAVRSAASNVRPVEVGAGQDVGALAPQSLADGECATFFWSVDDSHRFLVFENETEGFARVFASGATHDFHLPSRDGGHVSGDTFERHYLDPARQIDIRLTGMIGDPLGAGLRIDRAVMRVEQPDGQRTVTPLIGHYRCRSRSLGAQNPG